MKKILFLESTWVTQARFSTSGLLTGVDNNFLNRSLNFHNCMVCVSLSFLACVFLHFLLWVELKNKK